MSKIRVFLRQHAVLPYFLLAFAVSTGGILVAVACEGVPINIMASSS